ncbi:ABC transporter substrate-binding protein [Aquincola sp. S2]|uniref:ABC transporter substrate-binding protein n=1 Tax=Pseudaquabacterium terrae TaxID=2732868 RepID=A0ABX2EBB5_9BURK|nr:ABC transporter substrate-binding protein [Aquabacterium terrae]NRF66052.1 ABC transporter substrate-binding protein [Aquabacterium terrae]
MPPTSRFLARALSVLLLAAAPLLQAATLRIASAFDPQTMDPHGLALLYHSRIAFQVHDCLVGRDEQFRLEPALAVSWQNTTPTSWRFKLRPGVKFHDGTAFTADDAVFSIERALGLTSQRAFSLKGLQSIKKVDELTIDFHLSTPDAVWPEKLWLVAMMSKAWAQKHGVEKAQDFNGKQETYAVRNAMGTGPYRLESYQPDVKLLLKRHPGYWGAADKRVGNVEDVSFIAIRSDATRLAALASGEVDLVLDPPFQDVGRLQSEGKLKVESITDIGTQYFTFDQSRDELLHGDVKDRNPFKDRRVRQAIAHALNVELIVQKVLRGQATPTGSFISPLVDGYLAEIDKRIPYDPAKAQALLKAAGYPKGFAVTLDCVNVAYREAVCQAATAMLQQVGIRASLRASPTNQFFPKLSQATSSFVEFGWTPALDPWATLNALFRSWDGTGAGTFNAGRYSNPKLDELIDAVRTEPDLTKRRARVGVALRLIQEDLPYIPLYRRSLNWAMAKKVKVVQWPNDTMELRFVRVQ